MIYDSKQGAKVGRARYGNDFEESKIKRDDGGKFMGKTKSGKDVYDDAGHEAHRDFDSRDHEDAASIHAAQGHKYGDANRPMRDYHADHGNLHGQVVEYGSSFDEIKAQAKDYPKPKGNK